MNLKRMLALFMALCLFILPLPALAAEAEEMLPPPGPVTFTDDLGRTFTIGNPQRVAALLSSFAQIWMLAGGSVAATSDDAWIDLMLPLPEDAVNLGNTKDLSLELLLSSAPDFILASTNTRQNLEWQEILDAIGIPTAYFNVANFEDYLRLLDICTQITGRSDLYITHGLEVQTKIEEVLESSRARLENSPAPTVLSIRASASSITIKNSQDNVLGEMLHTLGCINIADSDETLLEKLSLERILEEDPDFIFFVQRGDDEEGMRSYVQQMLMDHPAWSQLSAVKNNRVFFMEKELYNLKPNHRWGEAYEKLEEILSDEY